MDSKQFSGVTQAVFDCVKKTSHDAHNTVYEPDDADQGTATTKTAVGKVVVGFDLDVATSTITYTIQKKPFLVSAKEIFDGIESTIDGCRG